MRAPSRPSTRPSRPLFALARRLLGGVVRFDTLPADAQALGLDPSRPVVYALQIRQLSALLVLQAATERLGLPDPLSRPFAGPSGAADDGLRGWFALTRSGQPSPLAREPYRYSTRLQRLVAAGRRDPALDAQIVPVSIFWGRAPQKQSSVLKSLFADNWAVPGVLKQALRLALHGRQTLVKFGAPISLRATLDAADREGAADGIAGDVALRRLGRLLRSDYRRERELAIGPDLSHRRTLVNAIVDSEPVRQAIRETATVAKRPPDKVELEARRIAVRIAADWSYPWIRVFDVLLTALWNRLYDGVEQHRLDAIAAAGAGATLVYVPCHRSHVDYLLLSYVLYKQGLQPPHVAAGDNLDLPLIGPLLRKGGAFFLRRSFKGDALYGAVFREYLRAMVARGFPIEYFIEGGRSRTGRTLAPKAGLLAMTVDAYLQSPQRPLVFVPVWIGYERLVEGRSYVAELSGQPKQRESIGGLLRASRALRERWGKVWLNVGEPLRLDAFLDAQWPGWRVASAGLDAPEPLAAPAQAIGPSGAPAAESADRGSRADEREPGIPDAGDPPPSSAVADTPQARRQQAVSALARTLADRINAALVVNPANLLAVALDSAGGRAIDGAALVAQIDLVRAILVEAPASPLQQITPMGGEAVLGHASRQGLVRRVPHPLGEIVEIDEHAWHLLTYFRNNVMHALALPALLATLVARNERIEPTRVRAIVLELWPLLCEEFYLPADEDAMMARLQTLVKLFTDAGLARIHGAFLAAPQPTQPESVRLQGLAHLLQPVLTRHQIVIATLSRFAADGIAPAALEAISVLLAQRVSRLHEDASPEFADRTSFRAIIATLQRLGRIALRDGRLHPTEAIGQMALDAQHLLAADTRLALSHLTTLDDTALAAVQAAARR